MDPFFCSTLLLSSAVTVDSTLGCIEFVFSQLLWKYSCFQMFHADYFKSLVSQVNLSIDSLNKQLSSISDIHVKTSELFTPCRHSGVWILLEVEKQSLLCNFMPVMPKA